MTGARNENSVLFSLSSLKRAATARASRARQANKDGPISGKADLRALMGSATLWGASPPRSRLDDIMNLGGGGVYSPALMAPALSPPSVDFRALPPTTRWREQIEEQDAQF